MLKQLRRLSSVKLKVNFTIKILSAHFGANDGLNQGDLVFVVASKSSSINTTKTYPLNFKDEVLQAVFDNEVLKFTASVFEESKNVYERKVIELLVKRKLPNISWHDSPVIGRVIVKLDQILAVIAIQSSVRLCFPLEASNGGSNAAVVTLFTVNSLARDDTPIAETTVAEPNEKLEKRPSFFQRTFSFRDRTQSASSITVIESQKDSVNDIMIPSLENSDDKARNGKDENIHSDIDAKYSNSSVNQDSQRSPRLVPDEPERIMDDFNKDKEMNSKEEKTIMKYESFSDDFIDMDFEQNTRDPTVSTTMTDPSSDFQLITQFKSIMETEIFPKVSNKNINGKISRMLTKLNDYLKQSIILKDENKVLQTSVINLRSQLETSIYHVDELTALKEWLTTRSAWTVKRCDELERDRQSLQNLLEEANSRLAAKNTRRLSGRFIVKGHDSSLLTNLNTHNSKPNKVEDESAAIKHLSVGHSNRSSVSSTGKDNLVEIVVNSVDSDDEMDKKSPLRFDRTENASTTNIDDSDHHFTFEALHPQIVAAENPLAKNPPTRPLSQKNPNLDSKLNAPEPTSSSLFPQSNESYLHNDYAAATSSLLESTGVDDENLEENPMPNKAKKVIRGGRKSSNGKVSSIGRTQSVGSMIINNESNEMKEMKQELARVKLELEEYKDFFGPLNKSSNATADAEPTLPSNSTTDDNSDTKRRTSKSFLKTAANKNPLNSKSNTEANSALDSETNPHPKPIGRVVERRKSYEKTSYTPGEDIFKDLDVVVEEKSTPVTADADNFGPVNASDVSNNPLASVIESQQALIKKLENDKIFLQKKVRDLSERLQRAKKLTISLQEDFAGRSTEHARLRLERENIDLLKSNRELFMKLDQVTAEKDEIGFKNTKLEQERSLLQEQLDEALNRLYNAESTFLQTMAIQGDVHHEMY